MVRTYGKVLAGLDAHEVVAKVEAGQKVRVELEGQEFEFGKDEILINIDSKPGFNVSMENNLFVILETNLSPELISEGFAREFVSKVQQLRKSSGFEVLDNIKIYFDGDSDVANAVAAFEDYIKTETLALEIVKVEDSSLEKQNLNDHETGIRVERV